MSTEVPSPSETFLDPKLGPTLLPKRKLSPEHLASMKAGREKAREIKATRAARREERSKTAAEKLEETTRSFLSPKVKLDEEHFEEQIKSAKLMVRPVLAGISKCLEFYDLSGLDKDETESGAMAFGALVTQYGAQFNAWILVGLWAAGIIPSRVMEWRLNKLKLEKARQLSYMAKPAEPRGEKAVRVEANEPPPIPIPIIPGVNS